MSPNTLGHVLFHTSAAAFRAEKLSVAAGIADLRLVPTPRELSSDCGVALRFPVVAFGEIEHMLRDSGVPFDRMVAGSGAQTP